MKGGSYLYDIRHKHLGLMQFHMLKYRQLGSIRLTSRQNGLRFTLCAPPPGLRIRITPELKRQMLKGRQK